MQRYNNFIEKSSICISIFINQNVSVNGVAYIRLPKGEAVYALLDKNEWGDCVPEMHVSINKQDLVNLLLKTWKL